MGGLFHSISSIIITMKIKKIVEKHEFLYNLSRIKPAFFIEKEDERLLFLISQHATIDCNHEQRG
ncbi:galactitol-specific phosphotransferase system IIB component [Bacillus altitudinis]